ncbi:hypothetical protein SASPL_125180 [Salvia splendens]|uniref:Glutaredoxin domain-containing protein n=1 Tax=Salvia splendens TaxID=180675 RepID=A0A8X8XJH7_SALSN|nr:uncharacterized protein At3g28850-like [Salvia splendens]KAG6412501.1 hypothetical protein SASPL_125180 [Salvia splendens]
MLLGRTKSRVRFHDAPPKFSCSSFKDIHILLSDDDGGDTLASPRRLSICHRTRSSVKSLIRSLSHLPSFLENAAAAAVAAEEQKEEELRPEIRIPGAEATIVIYFTSLRVVRSTFEDCKAVRTILRAFRVPIDERDLSMDGRFTEELQEILGLTEKSKLMLPRVFIGGRYIGGAEEVRCLHETGELKKYMERLPRAALGTCDTCGGYGFILCIDCDGSRKCYNEKAGFRCCTLCNENGLIRCPSCSSAPL